MTSARTVGDEAEQSAFSAERFAFLALSPPVLMHELPFLAQKI
jgi:hypothetical protein